MKYPKKEAADPHEIIHELLSQLNKNLSDAIKNIDKGKLMMQKKRLEKPSLLRMFTELFEYERWWGNS